MKRFENVHSEENCIGRSFQTERQRLVPSSTNGNEYQDWRVTLTKPMAVARWLVKYSGAGARSGKYSSDIPRPTKSPCVSNRCHTEVLKEASVKPADMMATPDMVIDLDVSRRNILRRHRRVDGVVGTHAPCSIRDIRGFTRIPPAQVNP